MSAKYNDNQIGLGLLVIRIIAGLAMAKHGLQKVQNWDTMMEKFGDPIGIGTTASLSLTVFAELVCAGFIVIGLFTRLAAIPLIICMAVAFFMAHNGHLFSDGEMAGLYLAIFIMLFFTGAGKYSADKAIGK